MSKKISLVDDGKELKDSPLSTFSNLLADRHYHLHLQDIFQQESMSYISFSTHIFHGSLRLQQKCVKRQADRQADRQTGKAERNLSSKNTIPHDARKKTPNVIQSGPKNPWWLGFKYFSFIRRLFIRDVPFF